ncbi:MAG: UvrD-helicase domain-containing protein, partial [Dysgonamonadaceae bacterium]|nr:UvrD-helicase domain-containing protein [Dysgonamonadaceae bacterium]
MDTFLQQLNGSQRDAVLYNEGPSLVIAGAGSGKTRVLTCKIAYLLKQGIPPYNILALTFTNKAAKEMKSRIAAIVDDAAARRLWMGTFHSVFARILRREADKFGYRSDFTIYDAQDSQNLIKAIIKEKALDDKVYKPSVVQARISRVKNSLITPDIYAKDMELIADDRYYNRDRICEIYAAYWSRCRASGILDFDDLLLYTYLLFDKNPDVLNRYGNLFHFILVDEYQDTNSVQHAIVRLLAAEHHRVCVVGDDAQSIYSFRGANIGNILNFQKTYPESKLFKLEQNYRSTKNIVNAANSLIKNNKEQIFKTVFSENETGEKIRVISAYSDYEEGHNVANLIAEMRMNRQYDYQDFAVLYRINAQSRIFEEALRKKNMPYRIYGGLSFYQRKEVKDVIAYMRVVVNPNDEEAFKRIVNCPARGIGDTTVGKIISAAGLHGVSLWTVISHPLEYQLNINAGIAGKLKNFRLMIKQFINDNSTQNAHELGREIIHETGLAADLYNDKTPEGLSRVQNIDELVNSLYSFVTSRLEEGRQDYKLGDFLAEVSLLTDQDTDRDEQTDRITMMTVHAAKGLEFKNVFVVGLEENLFPSERSKNSLQAIEEERRLFYVAITRAKENVTLSYAKKRFFHGRSASCTPSRFLKDIDAGYLRFSGDTASERLFLKPSAPERIFMAAPESNLYLNPRKLSLLEEEKTVSSGRQSIGNLSVGNTVLHERFGKGIIMELTDEKENARATVEFENFGKKQM